MHSNVKTIFVIPLYYRFFPDKLTMLPGYVVPGQVICPLAETVKGKTPKYEAGRGIELTEQGLVSTLLGKLELEELSVPETTSQKFAKAAPLYRLNIANSFTNPYARDDGTAAHNSRRSSSQLPDVGDVVYAVVTRLATDQVHLRVLVVEARGTILADEGVGSDGQNSAGAVRCPAGTVGNLGELGEDYGAVIRLQDIRATERDKVKVQDSYRPGDIVRAKVLSVGDGTNYYLTTTSSDLGVVFAKSGSGVSMAPVDWQTMSSAATNETESRKCANPFVS